MRVRTALLALTALIPLAVTTPTAEAATVSPKHIVVIGDSLLEGCCYSQPGTTTVSYVPQIDRWSGTMTEQMSWPYPEALSAQGGTGYTNPGPATLRRQTYPDRIGGFLDAHPGADVVVIEGGVNDRTTDPAVYRAAVDATYDQVVERELDARVIVVTPYAPAGYTDPVRLAVIQQEATAHGFTVVTSTKFMGAGPLPNLAWVWEQDRFHPNYTGQYVFGLRIAQNLKGQGW